MKKIIYLQLFALITLSFLLVVVIIRMPLSRSEFVSFSQSINSYKLKDIQEKNKSYFISMSNDPYIILPKTTILNPPKSYFHINVEYLSKFCRASLGEPASFIQIFWRTSNESFSENKSDATPISMERASYLIPLRSLSLLSSIPQKTVDVHFRVDIVDKKRCKFKINKIILGTFI